jgi:DNA-directed RNA polymerase subunit M/transcription elongation factor TFIIS
MEVLVIIVIIVALIYGSNQKAKDKEIQQHNLREQNKGNASMQGVVKCPKCLSTQTSANKRGITVTTGLIGSQTVYITCLQCGHRWKAGS